MIIIKKLKGIAMLLAALVPLTMAQLVNAAGSASFSLSPSSGSYVSSSTLAVAVNATMTDSVNAVEADLTYDSSKLKFTSSDYSGSAFGFNLSEDTSTAGSIKIARGVSAGGTVTGAKKVVTLNFSVLQSSGTTSISFAGTSAIVRSSDNSNIWNGSTSGGTYSLTAPVVAAPAAPAPSQSTPAKKSTPAPAAQTNPSSTPQTPSTSVDTPVVTSIKPNSNYLVAVKVVDKNSKVKKGMEVTLNKQTVKTDAKGVASFTDVPAGSYTARVHLTKTTFQEQNIEVKAGDSTAAQSFTIKLETGSVPVLLIVVTTATVVALGCLVLFFARRPRRKVEQPSLNSAVPLPTPGVLDASNVQPLNIAQPGQAQPATVISPTSEVATEVKDEGNAV